MTTLQQRILSLPRAAKWALAALVAFAAYFGLVEPVLDAYNRFSVQADNRAAVLASFEAGGDAVRQADESVSIGSRRFGNVEFPGDAETRPVQFNQAVDEILRKHRITGQTSTTRVAQLGAGPLTLKLGKEFRVERIMKDIQFQAEPERVAAVIADLERTPVIAAVTRVQIRQADSRDEGERVVRAVVGVEAWVLTRKGQVR